MKMKRFLSILAVVVVLCTFCAVAAMADTTPSAPPTDGGGQGGTQPTPTVVDPDTIETQQYISVSVLSGDEQKIEEHVVDATNIVAGSYVAPTCTTQGKINLYCTETECASQKLWHTVTIAALGHEWSTEVHTWGDVEDIPTCQQSGYAVEVCERCGAEGETRDLSAIPHDFSKVVVDVDNCLEYKWHYECSYGCGTAETDSKGIVYHTEAAQKDKDGNLKHDWSDWSTEVEPTCCEEGTKTRVCVICGAKQAGSIDKVDHTYKIIDKHLDSCTQITVTYECTVPGCKCETKYGTDGKITEYGKTYQSVITGDFHQWEDLLNEDGSLCELYAEEQDDGSTVIKTVTLATCTDDGQKFVQCKYCGEVKAVEVKALGHDWGEWTQEKTYVKDGEEVGYWRRECQRCGSTEEVISAEKPADDEKPATPATPASDTTYTIDPNRVKVDSKSVSGTGTLVVIGDDEYAKLYARIAVTFKNADGDTLLVVTAPQINEDGTFDVLAKAPSGFTVEQVCLVAVTNTADLGPAYGSYAVSNNVIL